MTDDVKEKWDRIYSDASGLPGEPDRVLKENLHLLPAGGRALEIAAGMAANAIALAAHGFDTLAWDISEVAVQRVNEYARRQGLTLRSEVRDIVLEPPPPRCADVIIVSHFLDRTLVPHVKDALNDGGMLFYQTFTRDNTTGTGPKNPDFRLESNELLSLFAGLRIVVYREEGLVGDVKRGFRDEALLVATKV